MLKSVLLRMDRALESPPYNLIIHSVAVHRGDERVLSLARRDHAEADADGRLRVGDRVLHQPHVAGGSAQVLARGQDLSAAVRRQRLTPCRRRRPVEGYPTVWYVRGSGERE